MGYSPGREGSGESPSPQRRARMVSVTQKGELEFSQVSEVFFQKKERILLHLNHTGALRKLSQVCTWGLKY